MDKYICEFEAEVLSKNPKDCMRITNICMGQGEGGSLGEDYMQLIVSDDLVRREFHLNIGGSTVEVYSPWSISEVERLLEGIPLPLLKELTQKLKVRRPNKDTLIQETIHTIDLIYTDMLTGTFSLEELNIYFKKGTILRDMSEELEDITV